MKTIKLSFLAVLASFLFSSCGYNSMVTKDEAIASSWAQVENQYQRRADLIPNLVNTVKGYAAHEKETLEGVIKARSEAMSVKIDASNITPENIAAFQKAQSGLTGALSKLMLLREAYPDLKANQNFLDLQTQLEGTENRITKARGDFNEMTQDYNAYIRRFPKNLIASMFGFEKKGYFKAEAGSEKAPEVQF